MKKIVVTGHGHFATGLQSALELLVGKNEDILYVDFVESDSTAMLRANYEAVLNENPDSEFLFFCDLLGGTPYKTAATIASDNDRVGVVAGGNVGALVEMTVTKEEYTISELVERFITVTISATGVFEKRARSMQIEYNGEEGI